MSLWWSRTWSTLVSILKFFSRNNVDLVIRFQLNYFYIWCECVIVFLLNPPPIVHLAIRLRLVKHNETELFLRFRGFFPSGRNEWVSYCSYTRAPTTISFLPEIYCMNIIRVALVDTIFPLFPQKEKCLVLFSCSPCSSSFPSLFSDLFDFPPVSVFRYRNDLFAGCLLECWCISEVLVIIIRYSTIRKIIYVDFLLVSSKSRVSSVVGRGSAHCFDIPIVNDMTQPLPKLSIYQLPQKGAIVVVEFLRHHLQIQDCRCFFRLFWVSVFVRNKNVV